MTLFYRYDSKQTILEGGKWVDHKCVKETQFTPLPSPFHAAVILHSLADEIKTLPNVTEEVIANVRNGKKDGEVYGMFGRTSWGETYGMVPYSQLIIR